MNRQPNTVDAMIDHLEHVWADIGPDLRITTVDHPAGTIVEVWAPRIGRVDARIVRPWEHGA